MKKVIDPALWDVLRSDSGLGDGQLLEAFLAREDQVAFAALVHRHAAMVFGVCRRVVGNVHDAEDAFQATFLVLLRKAAGIRPRERVGNWLYGVAYRTALEARTLNARRRAKERQAARPEAQEVPGPAELSPAIDRELSRLPEKYRLPVVLCDLEERSLKEVAAQLGWKEGTLSGRLSRARALLAKRLTRRGFAVPQVAAAAGRPHALARSTTRTALLIAAGQAAPTADVAALVQGVLRAMVMNRLKIVTAFGALIVLAGLFANGLMRETRAADKGAPPQTEFTGKVVLVSARVGNSQVMSALEKVQVKQLGDRSFLVGSVVKSRITREDFPGPGKVVWVPLQDVSQLVEFEPKDIRE